MYPRISFCVYKGVWVYLRIRELQTAVISAPGISCLFLLTSVSPVYYCQGNVVFLSAPLCLPSLCNKQQLYLAIHAPAPQRCHSSAPQRPREDRPSPDQGEEDFFSLACGLLNLLHHVARHRWLIRVTLRRGSDEWLSFTRALEVMIKCERSQR